MKRSNGLRVTVSAVLAGSAAMLVGGAMPASAAASGVSATDMTNGTTAPDLVNSLVGGGVTVSNISYTGAGVAAGAFAGGTGASLGFDSGIVMGSGLVQSPGSPIACGDPKGVEGPNLCPGNTGQNNTAGDADLDVFSGFQTSDAAVLEFDFVPQEGNVQFQYVFSSDEYNEFANTQFNDTFAFLVNGANCALVPNTNLPVSINTINGGNPGGDPTPHNQAYYRDNAGGGVVDTEMDGLTTVLTCQANVNQGQTNHMKLAIADASDDVLDSNVFIKAGSLQSLKPTSTTYSGGFGVQYSDPLTLSGTLLDTGGSPLAISGKQLDFTLGTQTASASPTDATGSASTSLVVTQTPGSVATVGTSFAGDSVYAASSDSDPFSISKENCVLTMAPTILSSATGPTVITATLGEPDTSLGDRSNKTVSFSGLNASNNPVGPFIGTTDSSGNVSASANLGAGAYSFQASFAGDGYYLPCATASDTLVTVSGPQSKATGGGFITNGTGRTSFGFNVQSQVAGLQGQIQIRPPAKARFHGNVVLTLTGSGSQAQWTGTGRWNGVSGHRYTVAVVDNGTSGKKGDTISIVIKNPAGTQTVFSTAGAQPLKGGNIVVH
jgi:hypothetical protein